MYDLVRSRCEFVIFWRSCGVYVWQGEREFKEESVRRVRGREKRGDIIQCNKVTSGWTKIHTSRGRCVSRSFLSVLLLWFFFLGVRVVVF